MPRCAIRPTAGPREPTDTCASIVADRRRKRPHSLKRFGRLEPLPAGDRQKAERMAKAQNPLQEGLSVSQFVVSGSERCWLPRWSLSIVSLCESFACGRANFTAGALAEANGR